MHSEDSFTVIMKTRVNRCDSIFSIYDAAPGTGKYMKEVLVLNISFSR